MATKKTKRRAKSKSNGSAFLAMSEVLKAIEDNFKALAAMVPTGAAAKPKRKTATKRKVAAKRATARTKTAIKRAAVKTKRAMPKAKKPRRRGDKRPSATAPV